MHCMHINTEENEVIVLSFPCVAVFLSTLEEMHFLALNTRGRTLVLVNTKQNCLEMRH